MNQFAAKTATFLEVSSYGKEALEPGSRVISDGLYCFESLAEAGMTHTAIERGRASRRSVDPRFKWVNTCLANIKGAITGTCQAKPFGDGTPAAISPPTNTASTAISILRTWLRR